MNIERTLTDITNAVRSSTQKAPLSNIVKSVRTWVKKTDPFEWANFQEAVMEKYSITEEQFKSKFSPPVFLHDGYYPDELRDWLDGSNFAGFCRRYADYHKETESPASFHLFCSFAILGAALRRQVWVDQRIFKIWPAMQIILLGPSGQTAKSTAGNCAIHLVEESKRTKRIAGRITQEALYKGLGEETARTGSACGILYASEMSTLFTKNESYNQGLIQVLTDLYDSPSQVDNETKTSGTDHIRDVAVSFIGGSNEGWASFLDEASMMGGFMGRHLVAYQEGAVRSVPFPGEDNREEYAALLEMLMKTRFIKGEFTLTPTSKIWYERKYAWLKTNWPDDERTHGFWSRYGVHLLRLGMLFRAGEMVELATNSDEAMVQMPREIEIRHFTWADEILSWVSRQMPRIMFALGSTRQGEEMGKIVRFVAKQGGKASEGSLLRAMLKKMPPRTLREHLETLVKSGVLSQTPETIPIDGTMGYELKMGLDEI